jgi:7-cyano-7-deazaguanine tRNA-ribosyltransferase
MEFFVSWYPGDAHYPLYDDDCSLLISISSVPLEWTIRSLPKLPRRLLIDSGGYRFISTLELPRQLQAANRTHHSANVSTLYETALPTSDLIKQLPLLSPKKVLERQLSMLGGERVPSIVCALDYPMLNASLSWVEKDRCIAQTIAFAYELKNLIAQKGLPEYVVPMAIVQGYDVDSFRYCAHELMSIGFPLYGLGSLAPLKRHTQIMERVQTVASVVGAEKLHVFGVSIIQTVQTLRDMGVHSIDSARSAKSAAYNEILYSSPYRRFGILEPTSMETSLKGRIPRERRLSVPLHCNCPVCLKTPESIMGVGHRVNIRDRSIHNYYHLKRMFYEQYDE